MSKRVLLSLCLTLCALCAAGQAEEAADTAALPSIVPVETPESVVLDKTRLKEREDSLWWWNLVKQGKLQMKDPEVRWPKFLKWCVGVYNWADTTFNGYNPEYVKSTGKRWKCYLRDDNWVDSYAMHFGDNMNILMASDMTVNLGAYLQYMAVSVGYSVDMSNLIGNKPINYKRFEFGFNCALFTAEAYYTDTHGGSYIRKFGQYYPAGRYRLFKTYFPGVTMRTYGIDLYYFVNNKKYSQGAAYNFSKLQMKPAGSIIAGFTYSNQDIGLDFTQLPRELLPYFTAPIIKGKFHYDLYCAMIGYGYNLPFGRHKHFLFNVTAIPTLGVIHNYKDSFEGRSYMFSMNIKGRLALVYNIGDFFMGIHAKMDGHWYKSKEYSFFSSLETVSLSSGIRF